MAVPAAAAGGGAAGGAGARVRFSYFRYFDAASASMIPDLTTNGIRLSGGFWNPDGSGFLYSGGYQFENTSTFDAGPERAANHLDTATSLQIPARQWP